MEVQFHNHEYEKQLRQAEKPIPTISAFASLVNELGKGEEFLRDALVSPQSALLDLAIERGGDAAKGMNPHVAVEAYFPNQNQFLDGLNKLIRALSEAKTSISDYDLSGDAVMLSEGFVNDLRKRHTTFADTPEEQERYKVLTRLSKELAKYNEKAPILGLSKITLQTRLSNLVRVEGETFEPNTGLVKFPQ